MRLVLSLLVLIGSTTVTALATPKNVLVTGGNKGIGLAICQKLLQDHEDVCVYMGSRNLERGYKAAETIYKSLPNTKGRLQVLELDTSSDASVQAAFKKYQQDGNKELFGIINNAGIAYRHTLKEVIETNYFGTKRINDTFGSLLPRPGGRIVNIASASGPVFVQELAPGSALKRQLTEPWTIQGGIQQLDEMAQSIQNDNAYGLSKALVNAYTWWLSRMEPELRVNSVTPGYIQTDMTKGMGATNPPSKGAIPPTWLLMSNELDNQPTGRYYGSDCKRSPMHFYRGPGDPVYDGPDGPDSHTIIKESKHLKQTEL